MSLFMRSSKTNIYYFKPKIYNFINSHSIKSKVPNTYVKEIDKDGFQILQLIPEKTKIEKKTNKVINLHPTRTTEMSVNQDWPSIWPSAKTFQPHTVPIPIRQGYPKKGEISAGKYHNLELMKIPNFLHLTPPAIERHCKAIKKFCTKWPKKLNSSIMCAKYFPLNVSYSDYCYSGPSIREPLSRIITFRIKLSSLSLDSHAKDKMLRLLGDKYDIKTDYITIVTDRCPMRKQNYDYAEYLLTALYHESLHKEEWENEKTLADMEYYDWEKHESKKNLVTIYAWPEIPQDFDYSHIPHAEEYKIAISELINSGEDEQTLIKYKTAVKKIMFLKPEEHN